MTRPLPRFVFLLLVTLLCAGVAHANDPATRAAKRHFDRGEKLFALGKFSDALDEYQKAYDAKEIPDFLFNIGQCHRNLGDFEAAIFSFRKFLKLAPDAENRDQVEEYIAELEAEQEKASSRKLDLIKDPNPPPREGKPVYKKWWFWTGVAVIGAGSIAIIAATSSSDPLPPPTTTLGHQEF